MSGQLFREKFEVDFSPRGIDLEGFPYATWRKISRSVLKEEDRELFLKGEPQGDLILREAIREYLHAARGVNCDVSQIIIGAGNEYLLMLLSQIIGRDAVIAMENPTYRQAYRVLSGVGHKVLPVGIDKNGFCVKELEGAGCTGSLCDAVPPVPDRNRNAGEKKTGAPFLGGRAARKIPDRG